MARDTADLVPPAPAGLTYVNDGDLGLTRAAGEAGFAYRDAKGRAVTDEAVLAQTGVLGAPASPQLGSLPEPGRP